MTSAPNSLHTAKATRPISTAPAGGHELKVRFARVSARPIAIFAVHGALGLALIGPAAARDFCITCSEPDAVYSCQVETGFTLPAEAAAKLHCIKELARRGAHRSCSVSRRNVDMPCKGESVVLLPPASMPAEPGNVPAVLPAGTPHNALPTGRPAEVIGSHGEQDYRYAPAPAGAQTSSQARPDGEDPRVRQDDPRASEQLDAAHQRAPGQEPDAQPGDAPPEEPTKRSNKPPKTVEELAKRAAEDSQKGLQKAGELVTDTAKSTGEGIQNAGKAVGDAAKKTWDCVSSLFSKC